MNLTNLADDCILQIAKYCDAATAQNLKVVLQQRGDIISHRLTPSYILSKLVPDVHELLNVMRKCNVVLGGERALQYFDPSYDANGTPWRFYCSGDTSKFRTYLENKGYSLDTFSYKTGNIFRGSNISITEMYYANSIEATLISRYTCYQCFISADYAMHLNWNLTCRHMYFSYRLNKSVLSSLYSCCYACQIKHQVEIIMHTDMIPYLYGVTQDIYNMNLPVDSDSVALLSYTIMLNDLSINYNEPCEHCPIDIHMAYEYIYNIHRCDKSYQPENIPIGYNYYQSYCSEFNERPPAFNVTYNKDYIPFILRNRCSLDDDVLTIYFTKDVKNRPIASWLEIFHELDERRVKFRNFQCCRYHVPGQYECKPLLGYSI